jgi:hypothetical protein
VHAASWKRAPWNSCLEYWSTGMIATSMICFGCINGISFKFNDIFPPRFRIEPVDRHLQWNRPLAAPIN